MIRAGTVAIATRGCLALVVLWLGMLWAADAAEAPATAEIDGQSGPIDVLIIGSYSPDRRDSWWPRLQQDCARRAVRLHILGEGIRADSLAFDRFDEAFLRQFHVVIFNGVPSAESYVGEAPEREQVAAAFRDHLDGYYKAGGSILWCPSGSEDGGHHWNELIGKRYDAQSFNESIHDASKTVLANALFARQLNQYYIWTSAIAEHPLTEGVRGLLLPLRGDHNWPGTVPMRYGPTWTALVRGMESTRTYGRRGEPGSGHGTHGFRASAADFQPETGGAYQGAPEIVGARDTIDGSGRMLVLPFHTAYTWLNYGNWVTGDAFMLKGAGGHPGDGFQLVINGLKWLARPSLAAGMGGYEAPPERRGAARVPPIDWSKAEFAENSWSGMGTWWNARLQEDHVMSELVTPEARDFKGIIGARTALSNGRGTVADYVVEGKRLGLAFIVFLEDLTAIDPKGYARLVADCKALSDDSFRAVPGYIYRDTLDVLYYLVDEEFLPAEENLTADRRVKTPNVLNLYRGSGIAELGRKRIDPWYLLSYNSIAPIVYDDARQIDEAFDVYLSLQGRMHPHPPVALTIVRDPATLAATVEKAHLTIIRAEHLEQTMGRIAWKKLWNPNPVYISSGPTILRWGMLNPIGHPFGIGKQRTRFALELASDSGIAEVKILEARSGRIFRHFRPEGAKSFSCTIDETHKDHWYLVPVITDVNGRQAIGPTLLTYQDGNRILPYGQFGDNIDAGNSVRGYDKQRRNLLEFAGWTGGLWTKGRLTAGNRPDTPGESLRIRAFDGGGVAGSHCNVSPKVITATGEEEPRHEAYRFENWLFSFDYASADYIGDSHYLQDQRRKRDGFPGNWWSITEAPVPTEIADITVRTTAVRARHDAPVSANTRAISVTFKKDCTPRRIEICKTWRSFDWGAMFVAVKDTQGTHAWQDDGKENRFQKKGQLGPGDYIFPGTDAAGAPVVINLGPEILTYEYANQRFSLFLDGEDRQVEAGQTIAANIVILSKPWKGQNTTQWIDDYIADYGIGGGTPRYAANVTQGTLRGSDHAIRIGAAIGGAAIDVARRPLPHNLLVHVDGIPPNAVAGRYDTVRKQLLILPVFERVVTTSVNTTLGDTALYVGELFRCDSEDVLLSCVQDGPDTLLLEVHNPTVSPRTVTLSALPGFTPLVGLDETIDVPPFASVKRTLAAQAGSLIEREYEGD